MSPLRSMNSVLKHALLFEVGKYVGKSPMGLGVDLLVLWLPVSQSVWSELIELFLSNPDEHRREGGAIERHGFPT